jgi:hypothetical protein
MVNLVVAIIISDITSLNQKAKVNLPVVIRALNQLDFNVFNQMTAMSKLL